MTNLPMGLWQNVCVTLVFQGESSVISEIIFIMCTQETIPEIIIEAFTYFIFSSLFKL